MSLGLHEQRRRQRSHVRILWVRWFFALMLVSVAGLYSYEYGAELASSEAVTLSRNIVELESAVTALEEQNGALKTIVEGERLRITEWRKRYRDDVPSGDTKKLYSQIKRKLDSGVTADRLGFVIGAAENERSCDEAPVTRRFFVKTPLFKGANDSIGFADNTITITAQGESKTDDAGRLQQRFDPAASVMIRFTQIGGATSIAKGQLPLHHSVIIGQTEHRFTMIAGKSGFVLVSGDKCLYP